MAPAAGADARRLTPAEFTVAALAEALALGALHGPLELLPVSSSAHVAAIPAALNWEVAGWSGTARKELEVALHAGTGVALVWLLSRGCLPVGAAYRPGGIPMLVPALAVPAAAGFALEEVIEGELRGSGPLVGGLLLGAAALTLADSRGGARPAHAAGWRDGAWIGLAQGTALAPGISRSGATLAVARARGFDRRAASELSWSAGLPVLLGAGALKAWRVVRGGAWRERGRPLAAGAGAAFASTLWAAARLGPVRTGPLWRWSAWRACLAAAVWLVGENAARD